MDSKTIGASRLFRVVLVCSLALNLIIVGVVAGAAFSGRWEKGPRGFDFGVGPFAAALAPDDRKAMRDTLRDQGVGLRLRRDEIAGRQQDMLAALRAEPFEQAPLDAHFAQMRMRGAALQEAAQAAFVARIAAMTTQERAAFAERLETELQRVRRRPEGH